MKFRRSFRIIFCLTICALLTYGAFSCSGDDDDENELPFDLGCDRGYELVFDVEAASGSTLPIFRYWLLEYETDLLSGRARNLDDGREFIALGQTEGEDSYIVTFTPGSNYLGYECTKPISFSIDLKDLTGRMDVYCNLTLLDSIDVLATVSCDETNVDLEEED